MTRKFSRHLVVLLTLAAGPGVQAGDGHNHSDEAPVTAGTASPRVQAHSDLFELVGIVDKGQMTVYLDRFATNEPVTGAKIEFESGPNRGIAQAQAGGTYLIKFDALARPGELPFAFTITAGADTDLLAGDLDLGGPHGHAGEEGVSPWWRRPVYALYAAVALAALAAATLGIAALRRRKLRAAHLNG